MTKPFTLKLFVSSPPMHTYSSMQQYGTCKNIWIFFLYNGKTFCLEFKSTKSQVLLM